MCLIYKRFKMQQTYIYNQPFLLEQGATLPKLEISYHTYGNLNKERSNVIWICHALTANADVQDWWPGMVGSRLAFDTDKYFVVCANIIGSCYGSSGPLSINPATGEPYYSSFPEVTIRDMVKAHIILKDHLQISSIKLLAGGSMGGYQCLEWAIIEPDGIQQLFLLATSATESAWGIAIHTAQRMALMADTSWNEMNEKAGIKGVAAARAIGMLTYRNYGIMVKKQTDSNIEKFDHYKASSYIQYQGKKLASRFNAYSYWLLTRAMDSHHICRGRAKTVQQLLQSLPQKTHIIGLSSDILCPVHEQELIANSIPNASLDVIDSEYGHDGFLVEAKKITERLFARLFL
jgi:homoserine O-acetyltransferase